MPELKNSFQRLGVSKLIVPGIILIDLNHERTKKLVPLNTTFKTSPEGDYKGFVREVIQLQSNYPKMPIFSYINICRAAVNSDLFDEFFVIFLFQELDSLLFQSSFSNWKKWQMNWNDSAVPRLWKT